MFSRNYSKWWTVEETNATMANFYPVNSQIFLRDQQNQMTVLTDRSQGGTSLMDGQLEIMAILMW
jgi:lysosomal alpha-mannosidase